MDNSNVGQKISEQIPDEIDYLLVSASFEDRCLSMYEHLDAGKVSKAGVFYFEQFSQSSSNNLAKLESKFNAETYKLNYSSPMSIADNVVSFLSEIDGNPNIVVDISAFTRESILIILRYLLINQIHFNKILIFYRFASVSDYLSSSVVTIRSVLGYIGDISINKPTHLILLSGFEYERAMEIIDTIEPDFISIGYGGRDSSITQELHERNKKFTKKLAAYYSSEYINIFEHSLRDPVSVRQDILKLTDEKPRYNTIIAPLNNKISTVGVALAATKNTNIQLIYAQMAEYNEASYSQCEDDCLIFDLFQISM